MAVPASKPPAGNHNDEALEILRRLEPMLSKLDERQRKQGEDIAEIKGVLKSVALREDVARVDGRVSGVDGRVSGVDGRIAGLEGQLRQIPTIWQLAGLIFAIFGAAFVLIRFASGH